MFTPLRWAALLLAALVFVACEPEPLVETTLENIDPTPELAARYADLQDQMRTEIQELETSVRTAHARSEVVLPEGSVDGLAEAIAAAGPGGRVVVASGAHYESGTVVIPYKIHLVGEEDARLIFATRPLGVAGKIEPDLHVKDAPGTIIRNLEITPASPRGATAIMIENSDRSAVLRNKVVDHQVGVWVENSDRFYMISNDFPNGPQWREPTGESSPRALMFNSGKGARIYSNKASGGVLGFWLCDEGGYFAGNEVSDNFIGVLLCKIPEQYNIILPNDEVAKAELSATKWAVFDNYAHDNLDVGYLAIDGAERNWLLKNRAENNANLDYDFAGATDRVGFPAPTSRNNVGWIFNDDTVLDCGVDNRIVGGDEQDNTGDACF